MVPGEDREFLPEVIRLMETVKNTPELHPYMEKILVLPGRSSASGAARIAHWLVQRAFQVGPENTMQDLGKYIAATTIPVRNVATIVGLDLHRTCNIDDSIRLIPFDDLEQSENKHAIQLRAFDRMILPSAVLIRDFDLPKLLKEWSSIQGNELSDFQEGANEILLCAGLFGPTAPYFDAAWWEIPEWVPSFGHGHLFSNASFRPLFSAWPEDAYDNFPAFYRVFHGLEESEKRHFGIPLERLNSAMHPLSLVNAAIDCRIALESIFLSEEQGDHGELGFRICVRAAKYTADNAESRRRIFDQTRDLYREGSIAVHTGAVKELHGRSPKALLSDGYTLIAATLRKMVLQGRPDWNEIDLS
jgi:hypothetical protein